jgi:Barstar (barnase inhibitor)
MSWASRLSDMSSAPEMLLLEADPRDVSDAVWDWSEAGLTVRVVRGRKMPTVPRLFDEFAAALQFPWYFGENWSAFDECVADLEWLPPRAGYVVVITDARDVLATAPPNALEVLVTTLTDAWSELGTPTTRGEWWDRPGVPFHVVLGAGVGEAVATRQRWVAAGASVVAP